jgi:hypothetical protein
MISFTQPLIHFILSLVFLFIVGVHCIFINSESKEVIYNYKGTNGDNDNECTTQRLNYECVALEN